MRLSLDYIARPHLKLKNQGWRDGSAIRTPAVLPGDPSLVPSDFIM